ncbi:MAG: LacI family transcriptional regulator [Anaerolineaceae bacterium]|nr:LacI family transcriptional regulator [Anaerolineaceae bacterium]
MNTRKVTIKDVAQKAGVSPATASRVAGGYGYVSEEKRRKVLAAIKELKYRPNAVARSMVTNSTGIIGLVVTDIQNPFFAQLARGVEEAIWKEGFTLILANTDEDVKHEDDIIHALLEKQVDGLIIVPASSKNSFYIQEFIQKGNPLVFVDRGVEKISADVILVDNEQGAFQAISHLISLGHQRIGMVIDNLDITTNIERLAGYHQAMRQNNLPIEENLIQSCKYTRQSAFDVVVKMLGSDNPPTALFTANNFMTIGAMRAIQEIGLKIPADIALVGFDDLEWNLIGEPQLTAVSQPTHDMGVVAAQRLLARLNGDIAPPMEIRLKTTFIIRQSCGAHFVDV